MKTTREIKFRGKRLDNGEWVYGDYFTSTDEGGGIVHIIRQYSEDKRGYKDYRVNPKTVGQFTGLKDLNGKEVYEGDILKQYNQKRLCVVELIDEKENGRHFCGFRIHNPEKKIVIGNIHENPELLTQTQNDRTT